MMCTGLAFIGVITFVSNSSIVFVDYYGLSPRIQGACFSVVMLGAAIGSFINGRLVTIRGISTMIGLGTACLAVGGSLALIVCLTDSGVVPLVATVMLYAFGIGFVFANTVARTMSYFRQNAGAVSAVFAVNQFLFGAIVTAGLSTIATPTLIPLGVALGSSGLVTAGLWWGWLRNTPFTRHAAGNSA
jgi:MFS family permease